jgi:hypothetical protein
MATVPSIESIRTAALKLRPGARVQLAHALVESLASLSEAEIAELWQVEVAGIPGAEVFRRIRAQYGK